MRRFTTSFILISLLTLSSLAKAQALSDEEVELIELINSERAQAGLDQLIPSEQLSQVARGHSMDMATNQFFSHHSPTTGDLGSRLRSSAIPYRRAGENIALDHSVGEAHQAFMSSPHHRENVLDPSSTHVGVGIVQAGNRIMVTEVVTNLQEGAVIDEANINDGQPMEESEELDVEPQPPQTADQPAPGLMLPSPELGAALPQPEPEVQAEPEPPLIPEQAQPQLAGIIPQPWFDAALQGAQAVLTPPQPQPQPQQPQPQPQQPQAAPAPEANTPPQVGQAPALTPGIWVIAADGSRQRIELGPETILRLLSAL
jgi:hypothetical protein